MTFHIADIGVGCVALIFVAVILFIISFALDVLKGAIGLQVILFGVAGVILLFGLVLLFVYITEKR
jgi:hypothetical protein